MTVRVRRKPREGAYWCRVCLRPVRSASPRAIARHEQTRAHQECERKGGRKV